MKFRNYCIVVMGETTGVLGEIIKISETKPNVLDAKGIMIATFSSIGEPKELTDYFKLNGRNFLLFDLSIENSGFNFEKDDINHGLFGFLKDMTDDTLKEKTNELIQEISSTTVTNKTQRVPNTDSEQPMSLEQQLQKAVDNEDYELAVKLRDTMQKPNND